MHLLLLVAMIVIATGRFLFERTGLLMGNAIVGVLAVMELAWFASTDPSIGISVVAVTVVSSLLQATTGHERLWLVRWFLAAVGITIGLIAHEAHYSVSETLPIAAFVAARLAEAQTTAQRIRWLYLVSNALWLIYAIPLGAYGIATTQVLQACVGGAINCGVITDAQRIRVRLRMVGLAGRFTYYIRKG